MVQFSETTSTGDNDGMNHLDGFLLDFDPAGSNAPFSSQRIQTSSTVEPYFGETSARRFYTPDYSTNLIEGIGWQAVQTNISRSTGTTPVTDPATNAFRYYRMRVP